MSFIVAACWLHVINEVRCGPRKPKRRGMHNMGHAHQCHGATCLVSVPIWDHGSELLYSAGGKPAGILSVGWSLPPDDLSRHGLSSSITYTNPVRKCLPFIKHYMIIKVALHQGLHDNNIACE
jgi:hypothetical protein